MGPKTIMSAKEILMIAFGKKKAQIVKEAFFGPISEDVPASILQAHPNFTLLLDRKLRQKSCHNQQLRLQKLKLSHFNSLMRTKIAVCQATTAIFYCTMRKYLFII